MTDLPKKKHYMNYVQRTYLKEQRKKLHLTQADVSNNLGVSIVYYAQLESGRKGKRLPVRVLINIADILRFPLGKIIELEDNYIKEAYK